jgi:hypothetical protein
LIAVYEPGQQRPAESKPKPLQYEARDVVSLFKSLSWDVSSRGCRIRS